MFSFTQFYIQLQHLRSVSVHTNNYRIGITSLRRTIAELECLSAKGLIHIIPAQIETQTDPPDLHAEGHLDGASTIECTVNRDTLFQETELRSISYNFYASDCVHSLQLGYETTLYVKAQCCKAVKFLHVKFGTLFSVGHE